MVKKWRVKVIRPANKDEVFMAVMLVIDDVPGNNPEDARKNAEQFVRSLNEYDPWDVDDFIFEPVRIEQYDAAKVSIWAQSQD